MKCWLAQGSSVRRSTFSPLDSFSPYKRDLREMTDSNRLTDFIARLFMKIDNRINRGFLFVCLFFFCFCYFLFSKSPEYILRNVFSYYERSVSSKCQI